jgi:Zn-dependent protease
MTGTLTTIISVIILIMSIVVHEVSHGYMALYFGDRTALSAGRLTLNPLYHIDLVGSILVPGILLLSGSPFPFGWAKPVPYNEANLTNLKWGSFAVACAGVGANFLLAIVFGIIFRAGVLLGFGNEGFVYIVSLIILVNLGLGLFNLIPVPPLDGSKIVFSLLPARLRNVRTFLESYGFVLVFILVLILWQYDFLSPVLTFLFKVATGVTI